MKMRDRIWEKLCFSVLAAVIAVGAAWGIWRDAQPKFQDASVSVGTGTLEIGLFLTEYAEIEQAGFVTDPESVDLNAVGDQKIVLKHGGREETVTLTVLDTVAPELQLQDLVLTADMELKAEDFVTHLFDHSPVTVAFAQEPEIPADYSDLTLEIVAADESGNTTTAQCSAGFVWLRDEIYLEYGQTLTADMVLYHPETDQNALDAQQLEQINTAPLGTYELTGTVGSNRESCRVIVQDTQGPTLALKEHQVYLNSWYTPRITDFVDSAVDPSGDVQLRLVTEGLSSSIEGTFPVMIEAEDIYGNITTAETMLYVATDIHPPVIAPMEELVVAKNEIPDYMAGVSAEDAKDGPVMVTCDVSRVDTSKAGTYYVVYTAKDSSGNEATYKRKLTVNHDQADTDALVASVADGLDDDLEAIRDFVKWKIYYSSDWGGDDPVWHGFTTWTGNCYVHALCLKAVLDYKGFNTQLIWVTDKTHYWLIVEIEEGVWRHVDPTPADIHSLYSLMTDDLRWYTLSGRDWDRSAWPACE